MNFFFLFFSLALIVLFYNLIIYVAMFCQRKHLLRDSETGIIKGAEAVFLQGTNHKAVLCIHGYIGSPTDFADLPQAVNSLGYTVSVPLLPGHGRDPRDFSKVSDRDFLDYVCQQYKELFRTHDEVIVMGFSMGAALGALLCSKFDINRMILLAPFYEIVHKWFYIFPAAWYTLILAPMIPYVYRPVAFQQVNDHSKRGRIISYNFISLRGTLAAMKIAKQACLQKDRLPHQTLLIHSAGDQATSSAATEELAKQKQLQFLPLEKSNHMLLWDYDSAQVRAEILGFLKN